MPLGLRAAKVDPALASSVFITTLTDVFGFLRRSWGWRPIFLRYSASRQGEQRLGAEPNELNEA